jgi:tetratricopeptide (TPR) repeat protein
MKTKILVCLILLILGNCSLVVRGQGDYWFNKGQKAKKPEKKIEYFTKSIEIEGAKAETFLNRGDAYWSLAIDAAYNHPKIVIVFSHEQADFHNAKMMFNKAGEDYTKAMKIDSSCAKAYISRSNVYQQLRQKDKALTDLSKLIEIAPENAEAYLKRGSIYKNDFRDPEKALADFSRAIEIDPNNKDAYYGRGSVYKNDYMDFEKALADYNKLLEIDPNDAYAYLHCGDIYRITGRYDKAINEYNRSIEIDRKNYMAYNNRGLIYLIQSQYEKALRDFNKAIALQSDFPFAYNNTGYVYLQQDKFDLAIEYFNKCLSINDKFGEVNLNLALVCYMRGDKENAKSNFERAKELLPSLQEGMDGFIKSNKGWFYWTEKDKETLRKMFVELK